MVGLIDQYNMLCEKLGIELDCNEKNREGRVENENEDGAEEGEEGKKEGDIFKNFVHTCILSNIANLLSINCNLH